MLDALMAVGYSASRLIAANSRFILQLRLDINPKPSQNFSVTSGFLQKLAYDRLIEVERRFLWTRGDENERGRVPPVQ